MSTDQYSNTQFIKDLWIFIKPHKISFIFYSILLAIAYGLELIPAVIIAKIVDFFTNYSGGSIDTFYILLSIMLGSTLLGTILRISTKHYFSMLGYDIQGDVRISSFQKIIESDLAWHEKENTGNKMDKIFSGTNALKQFITLYSNQIMQIGVILVGVIAIFATMSIKYSILSIIFITIYLIVEFYVNNKIADRTLKAKIEIEKLSGKTFEFSSNISTIKSLGYESTMKNKVIEQNEKVLNEQRQNRKLHSIKAVSVQCIAAIFYIIFLYFVGKDVVAGMFTVGSIAIYFDYVRRIHTQVLGQITGQAGTVIDVKYNLCRMMTIYNSIPEIKEGSITKINNWKKIRFSNVFFKYKEEGVINDLSLDINKGDKIGIVSKSGGGKSTIFKLLLKLYLPTKGDILIDNYSIKDIKRDSLTNIISLVPQENEVFNLSFKENVVVDNNKFSNQRYLDAIKISQSDKVITKLSNKDETLIGEKGIRLSGGERQRLGIARAIYRNKDILIFDEATSHLDYETEKNVQEAIEDKLKGKTLLVAAHRLSTLQNMDRIIVLDKGKIIEQGNYASLMKKQGEFYKLWKKQKFKKI